MLIPLTCFFFSDRIKVLGRFLRPNFLFHFSFQPCAAHESDNEQRGAHKPVAHHGDPYAENAHSHAAHFRTEDRDAFGGKQIRQTHAHGPHGYCRDYHGEFRIAGGLEYAGQVERKRAHDRRAYAVEQGELYRKLRAGF